MSQYQPVYSGPAIQEERIMARQRHSVEQIVNKLRQADVEVAEVRTPIRR